MLRLLYPKNSIFRLHSDWLTMTCLFLDYAVIGCHNTIIIVLLWLDLYLSSLIGCHNNIAIMKYRSVIGCHNIIIIVPL